MSKKIKNKFGKSKKLFSLHYDFIMKETRIAAQVVKATTGMRAYSNTTVEEIQQNFLIHVWKRIGHYNVGQASMRTYIARLVDAYRRQNYGLALKSSRDPLYRHDDFFLFKPNNNVIYYDEIKDEVVRAAVAPDNDPLLEKLAERDMIDLIFEKISARKKKNRKNLSNEKCAAILKDIYAGIKSNQIVKRHKVSREVIRLARELSRKECYAVYAQYKGELK